MQIVCHLNSLTAPGFFNKENYSALPRSEGYLPRNPRPFPACIHFLAFPFQSIKREYIPRKMGNDFTVQVAAPQLLFSSIMSVNPCKLGFVVSGMLQFCFTCCE